jgi:hypothetical protein
MPIRRVAGIEQDGTIVTCTIGRTEFRLISAAYGDSLETAVATEMGAQDQSARTPGTYKTETAKLKMRVTRARRDFLPYMPKYGMGNARLSLVIGFFHPDSGSDSDLLQGARLTKIGANYENSNKPGEMEFELEFLQLFWGESRRTINLPRNQIQLPASL